MAFSVGRPQWDNAPEEEVMATINTTPLVDVMLVLLIIFLITIPVVTHTVPVQLPRQVSQPNQSRADTIHIAVVRDGTIYWNETAIDFPTLQSRLTQAAHQVPEPEVHIRGDLRAHYEPIGRVVAACQSAGLTRVGFVTEPPANP